jgi:hypothetical protein
LKGFELLASGPIRELADASSPLFPVPAIPLSDAFLRLVINPFQGVKPLLAPKLVSCDAVS